MKLLKIFGLIALFSLPLLAQETKPTPPTKDDETIKVSTSLIQLDVTVTDKKGNPVTDLKPEDFEVYENGKKQPITNFSFVSVDQTRPNVNPQNAKTDKNPLPIPPVKLKAEQVRRTYALVVDDLGLSLPSFSTVKQALRKFINEQMQEGDLVALVRTASGIGALQSFTSDKRQLLAAVEKIRWNPQGRGGIGYFEPINSNKFSPKEKLEEDLKTLNEYRTNNFSVGTLGSLTYIIRGLINLPGRKSVVLFSEGFPLTSNTEPNRIYEEMRVLADFANRASVVIYTVDPRGLLEVNFEAQDNIADIFGDRPNRAVRVRRDLFIENQLSLNFLAYETGGFPFINQNDTNKGLVEAVNDQNSYYLLGYQPDEDTFDPKKARFNKIQVKVKRDSLKVRYRSGFFSVTDEKIRSVPQTPQQKLVAALTSPFESNDINLNLYPVFQNDPVSGDIIQALVYIDAKNLQFTETNGKHKANFDLIAMTFGDNGAAVDRFVKNYSVEVGEKLYQNMLQNGFVYTLAVPIAKPGAYQFRIALRDTISEKVGSASQFIEVPDVKKKLVLSNIVLDNFSSTEWQKIKLGGSRDESEKSVLLDATLRQFKRQTILRYDYVIYNPKQSRTLETRLRLIKDSKIVHEESPTVVNYEGQTDLQRLQTGGAISLGRNLEIGTYLLQIIVTDKQESKPLAAQFVEFEIIE